MAYDILLRRQVSHNYARDNPDPKTSPRTLGMVTLGMAASILLLPKLFRTGEIQYYKRRLADPQSRITREMPIISMYELAGARKYKRQNSQS